MNTRRYPRKMTLDILLKFPPRILPRFSLGIPQNILSGFLPLIRTKLYLKIYPGFLRIAPEIHYYFSWKFSSGTVTDADSLRYFSIKSLVVVHLIWDFLQKQEVFFWRKSSRKLVHDFLLIFYSEVSPGISPKFSEI